MRSSNEKNTLQNKQVSSHLPNVEELSAHTILSIFESVPGLYLILKPDAPKFTIVAVSDAYAKATMTKREEILGKGLFEVFPDNPKDPHATGVKNLTASLTSVIKHKQPHRMAIQKYDIRKPKKEGGGYEVRYWSPLNSPVLDNKGDVSYIVHSVVDVTELSLAEKREKAAGKEAYEKQLFVNELLHTQKQLQENEERYRELAETTRIIPWESDLETGAFTYVGPQAITLLGYPLEKWYEPTFWPDHIDPEDREWVVQYCLDSSKKKKEYEFEYRMIDAKGKSLWLRDIVNVVEGKDKKKKLRGFMLDITERKRSEEALQESEQRFRELAETIPHIVFSSNAAGKVEYINQKWFEYSGASQDSDPDNWSAYIYPDDIASVLSVGEKARKNGESYEVEYRLKRYDGIYRWFIARTSPIKNKQGKIVRWFGTATDIDESKRADNNAHYLAEASKVLSSSLDFKTTLQNIAKLAVPEIADWCGIDLLTDNGLEQVAVVHKDPKKINWAKELRKEYPPDMNSPTGIAKVIRTGEVEYYPFISHELLVKIAMDKKHLKLLKHVGFTSAMIVPLYRQRKCIGAITFVSAEAKRQYPESDLNMAQELAARASLALDNAWLYKASQDAVSLRDDFISVASHELKTPVTSVKIFTEVLQKHSEQIGDQKATEHLSKMNKQLDKLTELIYNMLNISKIQAGRLEFNQKRFDFDAAVKEIVDVLQEGATKHKLIIDGKTNKKVYGDEDRIGQVVSNLVSNAIKYSPKADKVIIHLSSTDDEVIICVEDFGIGLAKEHGERIFERFYRVFDTTDKTFPGLGIGLYISSEIIKRHHGRLWVESDTGKGSKFYFSLPLNRVKRANGIKVL